VAKVFGLVDCNNFYVSCERVFNPSLNSRPVIVLSSNAGCAISRSAEAKAIGIKMGAPIFKIGDIVDRHGVAVLSANFCLYGDMSRRVMESLRELVPSIEVYSVDEAFIDLSRADGDCFEYALHISQVVEQWTGIPVSIGVAKTKTLAKAANKIAKKFTDDGVVYIGTEEQRRDCLEIVQVEDVWGVGRRLCKKLRAIGIGNALQLADADLEAIRKEFSVMLQRTAYELRGMVCYPLGSDDVPRKQVIYSRTFGKLVDSLAELKEALAVFTDRAAAKLRREGLAAAIVSVYVKTNEFKPEEPQHSNSIDIGLSRPTNHSPEMIKAAHDALVQLYKSGYKYKKMGICLFDLIDDALIQGDLFDQVEPETSDRAKRLSTTIDRINAEYGRGAIKFGSMGVGDKRRRWHSNQTMRSPKYTTRLDALPVVRTGL
jgi:DNA polymerase V